MSLTLSVASQLPQVPPWAHAGITIHHSLKTCKTLIQKSRGLVLHLLPVSSPWALLSLILQSLHTKLHIMNAFFKFFSYNFIYSVYVCLMCRSACVCVHSTLAGVRGQLV